MCTILELIYNERWAELQRAYLILDKYMKCMHAVLQWEEIEKDGASPTLTMIYATNALAKISKEVDCWDLGVHESLKRLEKECMQTLQELLPTKDHESVKDRDDRLPNLNHASVALGVHHCPDEINYIKRDGYSNISLCESFMLAWFHGIRDRNASDAKEMVFLIDDCYEGCDEWYTTIACTAGSCPSKKMFSCPSKKMFSKKQLAFELWRQELI